MPKGDRTIGTQRKPRSGAGRKPVGKHKKLVSLASTEIESLTELGDGSLSTGIDRLAARLPLIRKLKIHLEAINQYLPDEMQPRNEGFIRDCEDLLIEDAYEEVITEGAIAVKDSYIV